jgi:hypothetical protein
LYSKGTPGSNGGQTRGSYLGPCRATERPQLVFWKKNKEMQTKI